MWFSSSSIGYAYYIIPDTSVMGYDQFQCDELERNIKCECYFWFQHYTNIDYSNYWYDDTRVGGDYEGILSWGGLVL